MRKGDADSPSLAVSQERQAREQAEGGFGTFRQQMSFGVHVVVMMGAFYAMGHVAGGALGSKPAFVRVLLNPVSMCILLLRLGPCRRRRWAPSLREKPKPSHHPMCFHKHHDGPHHWQRAGPPQPLPAVLCILAVFSQLSDSSRLMQATRLKHAEAQQNTC